MPTEPTVSSELVAKEAADFIDREFGRLSGMTSAVDRMIACYVAGQASGISSLLERERTSREQGQAEGFAAAVQWLRDRSATKPPAALWHEASLLADQMEQSRKPGSADISEDA